MICAGQSMVCEACCGEVVIGGGGICRASAGSSSDATMKHVHFHGQDAHNNSQASQPAPSCFEIII